LNSSIARMMSSGFERMSALNFVICSSVVSATVITDARLSNQCLMPAKMPIS